MNPAAAYVVRRLAATAAVVMLVSVGVFSLLHISPGSVERTLLGNRPASPESLEAIRAQYNLDDPLPVQYARWLGGVLRGDLGISIRSGEPVTEMIARTLPLTLQLAAFGAVLAIVIGLPLGTIAAIRHGRAVDRGVVAVSIAGVSTPPFAAALLLLYLLAVRVDLFPVYGIGSGFAGRVQHLTLPAFALALANIGLVVRVTRAAMIRELSRDYVVFARGRGLSRSRTWRYALRNSLVPILTASGLIVTSTLVGTVLVEIAFALPGLGTQLVNAITFKDIPVVQAIALLLTVAIGLINLAVDLAYGLADPRLARTGRVASPTKVEQTVMP
jgi:peptide/nickel transport system permease protein